MGNESNVANEGRPMRILLSAYSIGVDKGSEPEAALQTMLMAARRHEVWVLTQPPYVEELIPWLRDHPLADHIHLEPVEPPAPTHGSDLRNVIRQSVWHDRWQRGAAQRAAELDRQLGFDLVHHVALAASWMRCGVATLGKPLVWGPVGGGVETPIRLLGDLGPKGLIEETVRTGARLVASAMPSVRLAPRVAAVIFTQNIETARRLRSRPDIIVLPHTVVTTIPAMPSQGPRTKDVVFVGRLVPWKGTRLAVRTMRYVQDQEATLRVYGDGPDRKAMLTAVNRWGLQDRVRLEGGIPRPELLARLARAGVMFHPSLHEEGGFAMAEALTMGTPMVYLAHGGGRASAEQWPVSPSAAVPPDWREATARRFAAVIDGFLADPPPVPSHPLPPCVDFAECFEEAYQRAAARRTVP
jgi:glycosyltransferase involved in cell wall biosynthesis